MGLKWLKNIAVKIETKQNSVFTYPVDKQKAYIEHFPNPKDGIERGYFQYCCQMKLRGAILHWITNVAALPLSLYLLATYKNTRSETQQPADAVFFSGGNRTNIVPDSLLKKYQNIAVISSDDKSLNREDCYFLKTVFRRYPFSWMLWLKLIIKVAQYSYTITKYKPQAVISCNEFSYTAPILTEYCRMRGVRSINVMHGEKLYDMHDAFSKFDEFFVWDQAYVDLLVSMRSSEDQFVIEQPQSLRIGCKHQIEKEYDYTYYFTEETDEELEIIAQSLKKMQEKGMRISVRPHPRFSDIRKVSMHFSFVNIENKENVTIEESLLRTNAAISLHSTVLYQAVCNSIPIVIDDIRNKKHFDKLKELEYICLNKEHKLLSELLGEMR